MLPHLIALPHWLSSIERVLIAIVIIWFGLAFNRGDPALTYFYLCTDCSRGLASDTTGSPCRDFLSSTVCQSPYLIWLNHRSAMSVGYENTPIIQIISGITLLLGWFFGKANIAELDLYAIGQGNIWRLLFSQLIFENTAETVVGLMLLYIFIQFERQMGTRKFAFFVFLSMTISLFNVISFQILAQSVDILFIPASGPYFLIFSMLAIYYCKY